MGIVKIFRVGEMGVGEMGSRQNGTNHRQNGSSRNGGRRNGSDSKRYQQKNRVYDIKWKRFRNMTIPSII